MSNYRKLKPRSAREDAGYNVGHALIALSGELLRRARMVESALRGPEFTVTYKNARTFGMNDMFSDSLAETITSNK